MRKKIVHNFNLSIKNSADINSSEELTQTIIKELAKVSQEINQQKDIVQLWQEQQYENTGAKNKYISSAEVGATNFNAKNSAIWNGNTTSASGEAIGSVNLSGAASISNALIGGGVVDNTSGMINSNTSASTTSPTSRVQNALNFSNSIITQTYANVSTQQKLTVPKILQTNNGEPPIEVIKAEIKKKLDAAIAANDTKTIQYWTNISKAFDEGATAKDFDGKKNQERFTQMFAVLKQSNSGITESQNFNWNIVRKKMIESIDTNILSGRISPESKKRWKAIKQQLSDDQINIANLFEQYDELFLLLKEVEGLKILANKITIITKTKIYPNLSSDKLYAAIGKKDVYVFLKGITDIQGSAVNKGAVKIKNTNTTSFIVGENLEFILDEVFIKQTLFQKENINWIVYHVEKNESTIFRDKGNSFHYNFDKAGTYKVEAYGKDPLANSKKDVNKAVFIELKIVAQEIVITPPAIITGSFIRTLAEEPLFKITLKNTEIKTLNPLKIYYQVENRHKKNVTIVLAERELDPTGIIKFPMQNLGEYCIKVSSKDEYNVAKKHSFTVIKNFIENIEKVKDNAENDIYFYSKANRNVVFKVKTFRIEPATPQEKQNVKWLVYDKNGNIYVPDRFKLEIENNDVEKPYLCKGESFSFPIPKKEGDFTIEAYSNSKDGIKSKSSKKISVKYPQVTAAQWTYKNGNKKKISGFGGEMNYIKASIPGYGNKPVRINFFLNDSKVVTYYNDTKTNEDGEINKILKFNTDLQKHFGIQSGKTAKIRFELEGIENGNEPYPLKKTANVYDEAILNVTTGIKIIDVYFKYEGNRVTPFTKVPFGAKVTGVVRTLNMVGKQVALNIFKDAQNVKHSKKTTVDNEGVAAINFILDKKWQEINSFLGVMDMFYLGMEGIATKLSFENGLNAMPSDNIISNYKTIEGNKYGIDIPYFLAKYQGGYEANLKVLLHDMNEYYISEKIIPQKEQVAYMLATVFTETFKTFKPIIESFWIKNKENREASYYRYDPVLASTEKRRTTAIARGNTKKGDGVKYCGRGYVQLTWKNNYQKVKDKFGVDVVNYPDKAMEPKLAAKIMIWGMNNGIFTGVSINRYINDSKTDYVNARKVINGTDRNKAIAEDAKEFVKDIKIIENSKMVKSKSSNLSANVRKVEEKITNSELNKVKLHFVGKTADDKSLSTKTKNILKEVGIKSKNYNIYISSTARSTYDQARIMYENCSKRGGVKKQIGIYAAPGEKVIDVYVKGIKSGDNQADIIMAMENKIKSLGPDTVSKHIADFKVLNTFDVPYGKLANMNDFLDEINKRKELDKVLVENDCYHIQIKQ